MAGESGGYQNTTQNRWHSNQDVFQGSVLDVQIAAR